MSLVQQAKADAKTFLTETSEFGQDIVFETPDATTTATVQGWSVEHYTAFDVEAGRINTRTLYIVVSESSLSDASYPVTNAAGNVSLLNHKVSVANSTNTVNKFRIVQQFPDRFLGIIGLNMEQFAE